MDGGESDTIVFMGKQFTFHAPIEDAGEGGAYVTIPLDVEAEFGKKRVKVKAWIDGQVYRGSLVRMGSDCHLLGIRREIREKIGKGIGDIVDVILQEDDEPRVVTPPADFQAALMEHPNAMACFNRLSYSHQQEYVAWVEEAKKPETRQRRIQKAMAMLEEGKKGHKE